MKNKLQYIIIGVLIISNIFFVFNFKNKSGRVNNEEYKREMNYLNERLGFDKEQLKLAKKEYKRYDSIKRKVEKRFRRYDLIIMDDISRGIGDNSLNMSEYYDVAIVLNEVKLNHWINIREIADENQAQKLDSIWSRMKERIRSKK